MAVVGHGRHHGIMSVGNFNIPILVMIIKNHSKYAQHAQECVYRGCSILVLHSYALISLS